MICPRGFNWTCLKQCDSMGEPRHTARAKGQIAGFLHVRTRPFYWERRDASNSSGDLRSSASAFELHEGRRVPLDGFGVTRAMSAGRQSVSTASSSSAHKIDPNMLL